MIKEARAPWRSSIRLMYKYIGNQWPPHRWGHRLASFYESDGVR